MHKAAGRGNNSNRGSSRKGNVRFNPAKMYRNVSTPKGLALFMSNANFSGPPGKPLPTRTVAGTDEFNMVMTFTQQGYEVIVKRNLTAEQIRQAILDFRNDPRHNSLDSAMVSIMSHGKSHGIYGTDGELVDLAEVIDPFNDQNCPSLAGKPKFFTIQACEVEPVGPGEGGIVQLSDLTGPDMILTFSSAKADSPLPLPLTFSTLTKEFYM